MTKRQIDRILTMVPQIATTILAAIVFAAFLGGTARPPTPIVWHKSTPAERLACERQHLADALSEARSQREGRPYNSLKPC